ncbi:ribosomal-protein-alanine acetyltransferase [Agreia sp. Leaf244]|uniref:ribosomal protein S18-alanine N-acetyltransferase n=1 Tax=Agreia sp. Leaf244 TaxID=1736305 RepID=UPI0007016EF5|nr:ribosomal protein S18-alanine N-acetyltransferase [Agreia sp. Leaf244]KQO09760.1 ribosomal-protein-alanine acetyltransferase [Agreia sp. Leaf244]
MTWQLRRAGVDDLDAIMRIESSVFTTDAWTPDAMRADLASEHCYYVVALPASDPPSSTTISGYAGLLAPRGAKEGDIQTIAVAPGARRNGLGRVLMTSLLNEARRRGAREVFLEVRADNPHAEALYESLGFERLGVRAGYYQPDNVDAIVMRAAVPQPQTRWTGADKVEEIEP